MRVFLFALVLLLSGSTALATRYYVVGDGASAGAYTLAEDNIDVRQAVTATRFDLQANADKIVVLVRRRPDGRETIRELPVADLINTPDDPNANPPLQPDDVLIIRPAPPKPAVDPAREKMQTFEKAVRAETDRVTRALEAKKSDEAGAHIADARKVIDEAEKSSADVPGIKIYTGLLRNGLRRTEGALANDDLEGALILARNKFNPGDVNAGGPGPWFRVRQPGPQKTINDVTQRSDKTLRQRTLDALLQTLTSSNTAGDVADALAVFPSIKNVPFDREPFLKAARTRLAHESADVRALAMTAIAALGGDASDVPAIAALAKDKSPAVRSAVSAALYAVAGEQPGEPVFAAVDALLDDYVPSVQHSTVQSLWGHPVSPASEKKLIELSAPPRRRLAAKRIDR